MNKKLLAKIKKIKCLVLDVDGILTDGKIIIDHQGHEIKNFDVKDGFGIVFFKKAGYKTAIISARSSAAVTARAQDLQIDKVFQDAHPKIDAYKKLLQEWHLHDEEVCFMGDDLPDMAVLKNAGFAVTVPQAVSEVKKIVDYVTEHKAGEGAVREVIELILKTQGHWKKVLQTYAIHN